MAFGQNFKAPRWAVSSQLQKKEVGKLIRGWWSGCVYAVYANDLDIPQPSPRFASDRPADWLQHKCETRVSTQPTFAQSSPQTNYLLPPLPSHPLRLPPLPSLLLYTNDLFFFPAISAFCVGPSRGLVAVCEITTTEPTYAQVSLYDLHSTKGLLSCGNSTEALGGLNLRRSGYTSVAVDTVGEKVALLTPLYEDPKNVFSPRTGSIIQVALRGGNNQLALAAQYKVGTIALAAQYKVGTISSRWRRSTRWGGHQHPARVGGAVQGRNNQLALAAQYEVGRASTSR